MFTVIIPTLNEQNTILQVIQLVKKNPLVKKIKECGIGFSFCSSSQTLNLVAD